MIEPNCHGILFSGERSTGLTDSNMEAVAGLPNECFVYMIQAGAGGPVKIGIARNPFARVRELQTGCFARLQLIHVEGMGNRKKALSVESTLHNIFGEYRIIGEWFRCAGRLKQSISHCAWGDTLLDVLRDVDLNTASLATEAE